MTLSRTILAAGFAATVGLGVALPAAAHDPGEGGQAPECGWGCGWGRDAMPGYGMMGRGYGRGMMGPGMTGPGDGRGMMGHGYGRGMMGPGYGQGMMGPGMMGPEYGQGMMGPGYGMTGPGYGMMGPGYGPGMTDRGYGPGMAEPLRADLSADDVRHMLGHRLEWAGNPHLKLGAVEEKDADTIVAEIVTQDGSLVERLEVDRHTGFTQPVE